MDQNFPSFKYVVSQLILRCARESFPLCSCTTMISTKIVDSFQNSGSQWHLRWILHYFYVSVSQQFYLQDVALIVYRHLNKLTLNHQIGLEKTSELKTRKFIWTYIYFTVFSLVENNSKLKGNQRFLIKIGSWHSSLHCNIELRKSYIENQQWKKLLIPCCGELMFSKLAIIV